jgi:DNA helicase-2/ATP-dependent DNA helicase PcrA
MDTMEDLRKLAGIPASGADAAGEPSAASAAVGELIEALLSQTRYVEALEAERTIEAQGRIENLEQLVEVGREFDARAGDDRDPHPPTLDVFLQQVALVADADSRSDEGRVTLMTLHNAKGLEYRVVFISGCEDGVFPHSRAIEEGSLEEERRLFYVGITRAMRQLYLTHARRRAVFGAQTYGMRSRFLDELPVDLLDEPRETFFRAASLDGRSGSTIGHGVNPRARGTNTVVEAWAAAHAGAEQGAVAGAAGDGGFRLGEDVVHAAFGEGVVTGVEPGGVIVVRFADDGSERKLLAEYAPVSHR